MSGGRGRIIYRMCLQSNISDSILIFVPNILGVIKLDCCLWPSWALSGGRRISRMCLHSNISDSILIFVPNILGVIKLDCCLWPSRALRGGGGEEFLECVYNQTFVILF